MGPFDTKSSSRPFRVAIALLAIVVVIVTALTLTGRLNTEVPDAQWCEYDSAVPLAGEVVLWLAIEDTRPGLGRVVASVDDGESIQVELLSVGEIPPLRPTATHRLVLDTRRLVDGPHKLAVHAFDRSLWHNESQLFEVVRVDNTAPTLTLERGPGAWEQGRTHSLVVRSDEPLARLQASFLERDAEFFPIGAGLLHRALVGVGVKEGPGPFEVVLHGQDLAGNLAELSAEVVIEDVRWPSGGYITLSSTQSKAQKDRDKGAEANARRGEAYDHREPSQLWAGPFLRPARGPVTSPFGKVRRYSTGAERHHLGVDIANTTGTPVVAPAAGVVTLAEELHIYGNAVILGHGQGISSSYNHLSEIAVQVGDEVVAGQRIGAMGSTGQSTGSHLHWGMVANGIAVDPMQWLEEGFEVGGEEE